MGVRVQVQEFEFEMPESWGSTAQEVAEAIPKHFNDFHHFLDEHAGPVGVINIRDDLTGFKGSIDLVIGNGHPYERMGNTSAIDSLNNFRIDTIKTKHAPPTLEQEISFLVGRIDHLLDKE